MFQILKMYLKNTGNTSCPVSITLNKELLWLIYCYFLQIYWHVQANYIYVIIFFIFIFFALSFQHSSILYVFFFLTCLFWWPFYQYILVTFSISIKKVFSFRKSYCSYTKQGKIRIQDLVSERFSFITS